MVLCVLLSPAGAGALSSSALAQQTPGDALETDQEAQRVAEEQEIQEATEFADERGITQEAARQRLEWQRRAPGLTEQARKELGGAFAGVWIDPADGDRVKLALAGESKTAEAAARRAVAAAGLEGAVDVVVVRYSEAELDEVSDWLTTHLGEVNDGAPLPLVFGTRADKNVVVLSLPRDARMTPDQGELVTEVSDRFGAMVETGFYDGSPRERACDYPFCTPPIRGGVRLGHTSESTGFCTTGFIARGRGANNDLFQMTAGHCTKGSGNYRTRLVPSGSWSNLGPGHNFYVGIWGDAGIYRILDNGFWNARSWVFVTAGPDTTRNEEYRIYSDAEPTLGQRTCTTGSFYGRSDCGTVTQLNFYDGTVGGLVRANFCGIGGDSGSPMYAYGVALGLQRGGLSECDSTYVRSQVAENLMNVDITHADP